MRDPVLVTGATGFIGSRVARRLLDRGRAVRVLVRDTSRLDPVLAREAQVVIGDVRHKGDLERAVSGAGTVIHLAALARAWSRTPSEFHDVNVEAVRQLIVCAEHAGVERLVHVSTMRSAEPAALRPVPGFARGPTPYEASKRGGDQLIADAVRRGLDAVVVRPTRVYGPGAIETDANAATRIVAQYLAGRFRVRIDDGDVLGNWVHVDDVAEGVVLAAERAGRGTAYALGGDNLSVREFLDLVGAIGGVRRRVFAVPPGAALLVGLAAELWGRLGGTAPFTARWVRGFLEARPVDIGPARRDLGYAPRSLVEGLTQTIDWLRKTPRG